MGDPTLPRLLIELVLLSLGALGAAGEAALKELANDPLIREEGDPLAVLARSPAHALAACRILLTAESFAAAVTCVRWFSFPFDWARRHPALDAGLVLALLGLGTALIYMHRSHYSKSFVITLALLPAMVQLVIMLVNGNLGTGVAVAGAFSLIRFRSVPGSAKEIGCIFFAMAIGLATGMGYLLFGFLFFLVVGAALLLLNATRFGESRQGDSLLRIVIPESLDYEGLFDDLFDQYTQAAELIRVKTTNMGSLYELTYQVRLKSPAAQKAFLDELRCRNGNLTISCGRLASDREEL